jgi:hypothetical protein
MSADRIAANQALLEGGVMSLPLAPGTRASKAVIANEKEAAELAKAIHKEAAVKAKALTAKRLSDSEKLRAAARAAEIQARRGEADADAPMGDEPDENT